MILFPIICTHSSLNYLLHPSRSSEPCRARTPRRERPRLWCDAPRLSPGISVHPAGPSIQYRGHPLSGPHPDPQPTHLDLLFLCGGG